MSWRARGIALSFYAIVLFFSFVVLVSQSEEGREGRRNTYCTPTTNSEALGLVFLFLSSVDRSVCWRFNWNESNIILGVGSMLKLILDPKRDAGTGKNLGLRNVATNKETKAGL